MFGGSKRASKSITLPEIKYHALQTAAKLSDGAKKSLREIGVAVEKEIKNSENVNFLIVDVDFTVDAKVISKYPNLKAISTLSVGMNHIDKKACTNSNIVVMNSPGSNADSVSTHCVALMLASFRKIVTADSDTRSGHWDRPKFMTTEITGSTVGLIGFGNIAKNVAKKLSGFGVSFIIYDPFLSREEIEEHPYVKGKAKKTSVLNYLCKEADIISLHVPKTPTTAGMIGAKQIKLMKPTTHIVNTSRGGLIDLNAAIEALSSSKLGGLALDVFETEPPSSSILSKLKSTPNTTLTPHISAMTLEARAAMESVSIDHLIEYITHDLEHE